MRRKIALTILAFACASPLCAQNRASDFRINKIDRELITTPQFNYSGGEQKRETRERWLRVDVQFTAVPAYTDELTFKYYIAMSGKVLSGEVTHVHILAGREHWSVMYVPPHALAYILEGRPPNTTSIGTTTGSLASVASNSRAIGCANASDGGVPVSSVLK